MVGTQPSRNCKPKPQGVTTQLSVRKAATHTTKDEEKIKIWMVIVENTVEGPKEFNVAPSFIKKKKKLE